MNGKRNPARRKMLGVVAMFAMALTALTLMPLAANAAENPLTLTVKQVFAASSPSAQAMFTYRLRPLGPGHPMPPDSAAEGYAFSITGNSSKVLGPLRYDQPGLYRYELSQVIGTATPGYTYDRRVYTIEAHVGTALKVELVVKNEDGTKAAEIEFENRYKVLPTNPPPTNPPTTNPPTTNPPTDPTTTKPGGTGGPKTGDDWNATVFIALFAFSGAVVIGAAIYLIVSKKRKKLK